MTKYYGIILGASSVIVVGILASMPLLVAAATLCACGTLLVTLLTFFQTTHA